MEITPQDAVISGSAYEDASTAIGVLEAGVEGNGRISSEMLCTLDNFVQAMLFQERIFLTISPWEENGKIIPGRVAYRGGLAGRKLIESAGIFSGLPPKFDNPEALRHQVDEILLPAEPRKYEWFIINCAYPQSKLVIRQELPSLDAYLMEDAIAQAGIEKFKPVFPGEHLYLGLRGRRLPPPRITQTLSDLVANRLNQAIRDGIAKSNIFVSLGAPLLPERPPIYVSRILRDCATGNDFVPVLLQIRNSRAFRALRAWMARCAALVQSQDSEQRAKGTDAWQKFLNYPLDQPVDKTALGIGAFNVTADLVQGDVLGAIGEVAGPIVDFFRNASFHGLQELSGNQADVKWLDAFFTDTFRDKFNRAEMFMISHHLNLPANLKDLADEDAELTAVSGRIYPDKGPLARSYTMTFRNPDELSEIMADFHDMKAKSQPLN